jgi:hypothetical protein
VTLSGLLGAQGQPAAETDWGQPLSAATLERICCDAGITRVLLDPAGVPLDVGREAGAGAREIEGILWILMRVVRSRSTYTGGMNSGSRSAPGRTFLIPAGCPALRGNIIQKPAIRWVPYTNKDKEFMSTVAAVRYLENRFRGRNYGIHYQVRFNNVRLPRNPSLILRIVYIMLVDRAGRRTYSFEVKVNGSVYNRQHLLPGRGDEPDRAGVLHVNHADIHVKPQLRPG